MSASTQHFGIYRGIVLSAADAEQRLRVQLDVPDIGLPPGTWAQACLPPGNSTPPDEGSLVWVMFEEGDLDRPVWMGVGVRA